METANTWGIVIAILAVITAAAELVREASEK